MVDFQSRTFAERYLLGRREQPYFARISGWELEFWDPATDNARVLLGMAHPVGSLDLRAVLHVEAFEVRRELYQVSIGMGGGSFSFHVRSREEADMWSQGLAWALIEHARVSREHLQGGLERSQDRVSHVVQARPPSDAGCGEAAPLRHEVSPMRKATLRRLWIQCLRAVANGGAAPSAAFADMFDLYDVDRDANLDLDELETMLRDLLAVRRDELESALAVQRERVVTPERIMLNGNALALWRKTVGDPGSGLLMHYEHMLQPRGFESRAVLLRSNLDSSHDGQVTLKEFVLGAPLLLLPQQELFQEAQFYKACHHVKEEFLEHHEKEEKGCLTQ